jgi:hypothetical protein
MGRRLRYVPEGGALVEITSRTVHGRYLLRPGRAFNEIFVGVLARAKRLYPVELTGVVCLSGHFHLLMHVEHAGRLSDFMRYFNGKDYASYCTSFLFGCLERSAEAARRRSRTSSGVAFVSAEGSS